MVNIILKGKLNYIRGSNLAKVAKVENIIETLIRRTQNVAMRGSSYQLFH